jgi:hypothetical protein
MRSYRCVRCTRCVPNSEGADDELEALFHDPSAKDDNGLCADCWNYWNERSRWVAMAAWLSGDWVKLRRFMAPYPQEYVSVHLKMTTLNQLRERGLVKRKQNYWELTSLGYDALRARISRKE